VLIADATGSTTRFRSLEVSPMAIPTTRSAGAATASSTRPKDRRWRSYCKAVRPDFKDPNAAEFTPDPRVMAEKSVLSAIKGRAIAGRRAGGGRQGTLDEYFTSLRQIEQQMDIQLQKPQPLEACSKTSKPDEKLPAPMSRRRPPTTSSSLKSWPTPWPATRHA